jgi:phenylpropionate dioxygenase-like ring-hydroxylating dioxygenase large terminal subunit
VEECEKKDVDSPKIHVLGDLTNSQQDAIRRIPDHDKADIPSIEATRPASTFTDQAVFEREQALVFTRLPVPVSLTAQIAERGSLIAQNGYGTPLLIMRDREGVVRTFLNVCTHKGAKLIEHCDPVRGARVTCPYHGWTFSLAGKLAGVARAETFTNLDKSARDLVELPCLESGGIIWAILDPHADADFSSLDEQLTADLDALDLSTSYVYGHKTFKLDANWKQVLEPFLEGYHVQRLHVESVGPLFADVPTVTDRMGKNIRQTSGKIEYTSDGVDNHNANIHKSVTHAYQVFPNTVVVTSPWYISVMILMPNGPGKTTVDYYMLTLNPADDQRSKALYAKSYDMVLDVFGNEDFRAAESCYTGLSTGALREVVYSGLEGAIPMFYETLDGCMA